MLAEPRALVDFVLVFLPDDERVELAPDDLARELALFDFEPLGRVLPAFDVPLDRDDALFFVAEVLLEDGLFLAEERADEEVLDEEPLDEVPLEVELDLDPVAVRDFDSVDLDFVPAEDEERFEVDADDVDFLPDDFLVAGILFPPVSIGRSKPILQSRYHCEIVVFGRVENRFLF